MTDTTPTESAPGRVERWKLTEPVRLYLWPVAALLLAPGIAGLVVGEWWGAASYVSATLAVLLMTEAARASVYSPRAVVRTLLEARHHL